MLWRPREGNEVLLIISWVMNIFDPFQLLLVIGGFCQMAGLALMTRMQLITEAPRLMRQLRKKRPLLLWVVLIIPPVIAVLIVPFAIGVASDGLTAALIAALLVPNIITQFVAVVLLNLRLKCITTLANHRWGQRILYLLKLISVLLLASGFPGAKEFATLVLLFGSLQDPAVATSRFGRCIDVIMNICFLWTLVLPSPRDIGLDNVILLPVLVLLIGNLQIFEFLDIFCVENFLI
jgi:hypothetical protein